MGLVVRCQFIGKNAMQEWQPISIKAVLCWQQGCKQLSFGRVAISLAAQCQNVGRSTDVRLAACEQQGTVMQCWQQGCKNGSQITTIRLEEKLCKAIHDTSGSSVNACWQWQLTVFFIPLTFGYSPGL